MVSILVNLDLADPVVIWTFCIQKWQIFSDVISVPEEQGLLQKDCQELSLKGGMKVAGNICGKVPFKATVESSPTHLSGLESCYEVNGDLTCVYSDSTAYWIVSSILYTLGKKKSDLECVATDKDAATLVKTFLDCARIADEYNSNREEPWLELNLAKILGCHFGFD
ncbi:MAG: hypothetical protein KA436_08375 [Oligoflexales bacterium]|nr:hypothetical protein [Oligoflexales bacterium]